MKKTISALMTLIMMASLWTTASAAPAAQTPEVGQLKVCKVAGTGVTLGTIFTFRVAGVTYNVPAGPGDNNGYCVLAGEYPVDTEVTVEEVIPSGYYVSRIEVRPDRDVSKATSEGIVTVRIGSGVTDAIFTNRVIGTPTPTPVDTATPRPTRTPTPTPSCAPNCTPTATPVPTGRMQICKEAEGDGVTGYFTFRFGTRSRTVPVGACAGLISVNAGTLTITEDVRTGFSIADIYTIPSSRLISKDLNARSATVRIVEGNAASQTIVIFRNRAVSVPDTSTPTSTATSTPTGTITPPTPTFTPTGSVTPSVCPPETITADFRGVQAGQSVEGLNVVASFLNIDAKGTAVKVAEGVNPLVYGAPNVGFIINGGLAEGGGFSDVDTKTALQPHLYTFTFAQGVSVSDFSLHMLDYGDFNPSNSTSHLVTMTAYNLSNDVVAQEILDFTSLGTNSPEYGNLLLTGDAVDAAPGQPGNWTWNVSGTGIVRIVLEFGPGHDPNIAFDLLTFTTEGCPICEPADITADFRSVQTGQTVGVLGMVASYLQIEAKGDAKKVVEGVNPLVYGAPNVGFIINGGLGEGGGFSDVDTKNALQPHLYTFIFTEGVSVSDFSLHMLDYGDFNPSNSTSHLVTFTAYNARNEMVDQQALDFTSQGNISPQYGNLILTGDAVDATPGQLGNWTWNVSGLGIERIVLEFGAGHDPNIAFDTLSFTTEGCP